jgi:hypothetical protein
MSDDVAQRDRSALPPWMPWILIAGAAVFLALGLMLPISKSWFWAFAMLPGLTGVANYIVVTSRQRDIKHMESLHRPTWNEAIAAALLLTGVFFIVASAEGKEDFNGLVFAGYGAYTSTLWLMLVRLNANALSPRFLLNSALKASIAMLIGFMVSTSGLLEPPGNVKFLGFYFLIGLFHSWAMKALKRTAMVTFGVTQTSAADLPVQLLEGVDDGAVDVLEELGVTSMQHLATMHGPEACGRSLYPRNRVLDWIDQSILAMHTNGRINDLRALGIRSAYALITIANHSVQWCGDRRTPLGDGAYELFEDAARRLGLSTQGLYLLTECIRTDPSYRELEDVYPDRHGKKPTSESEKTPPLPTVVPPYAEPGVQASPTIPIARPGDSSRG